MDESLYDEFGNYIGPSESSSSDDSSNYSTGNVGLFQDSDESENEKDIDMASEADVVSDNAVVLYEDKKIYPSMRELYGPETEILIEEEDAMPITEPIVAPLNKKKFYLTEPKVPKTEFENSFLAGMLTKTDLVRNVAVVGSLHHGKTSLIDILVKSTHHLESTSTNLNHQLDSPLLYTDSRQDERDRRISISAKPMTFVANCTEYLNGGKSYLLNIMDTPGHSNFADEQHVAFRACDGVLLIVDVVEGVTLTTDKLVRNSIREGLQIILVINKIDRLCLDLRLSPTDAYFKIAMLITELNKIIQDECSLYSLSKRKPLSPSNGNVIFGATGMGGSIFSTTAIARRLIEEAKNKNDLRKNHGGSRFSKNNKDSLRKSAFLEAYNAAFNRTDKTADNDIVFPLHFSSPTNSVIDDAEFFGKCLWGNIFFNSCSRTLHNSAEEAEKQTENNEEMDEDDDENDNPRVERTFIHFVLRPIWKLLALSLASEESDLKSAVLNPLGIKVARSAWEGDLKRLIRCVLASFFFDSANILTDTIVSMLPSPKEFALTRAQRDFCGPLTGILGNAISTCQYSAHPSSVNPIDGGNPDAPLVAFVLKHFADPSSDYQSVSSLVYVHSGSLKTNTRIKVLGETYDLNLNSDDCAMKELTNLRIMQAGRYAISVDFAPAGCWVLVDGLSDFVKKSATIVSLSASSEAHGVGRLRELKFENAAVFRVSCEPLRPHELPKMLTALKTVERVHPQSAVRIEESGEHVLFALGELSLDVMLFEVREVFGRSNTSTENSSLEIRVSEPTVLFQETISDFSSFNCSAYVNDRCGKVSFISQPMLDDTHTKISRGFAEDASILIRSFKNDLQSADKNIVKKITNFAKEELGLDSFSAQRVWAFGPELGGGNAAAISNIIQELHENTSALLARGNQADRKKRFFDRCGSLSHSCTASNILINDILPEDSLTGKYGLNLALAERLREPIVQGFQWACKEGPLIEEQVRKVTCRLTDIEDDAFTSTSENDNSEKYRVAGGKWVPTVRRAIYASLLLGVPRIMEPIMRGFLICANQECVNMVFTLVQKRRGQVVNDNEISGTSLFNMEVLIPAIDSFGFETDVRSHTLGQAMVEMWFERYETLSSDPLDSSIQFRPLETSSPDMLAREIFLKMRRRKGLREEINIQKFFDPSMLQKLANVRGDSYGFFGSTELETALSAAVGTRREDIEMQ